MSVVLELKNFQRIKHSKIVIKGLTVLRGESNLGKSSNRRALESILFGNFKQNYLKKDAKECEITLTYGKHSIKTIRNSKKNIYYVDGKEIVKGGRGALDVIKDLGWVDQDLTISNQYTPLFLLGEKGSAVANRVNSILKVDIFEKVVIHTKSKINTLKNEISYLDKQTKDLINKREDLTKLSKTIGEIAYKQKSIELIRDYIEKQERLKGLEELSKVIDTLKDKLAEYKLVKKYLKIDKRVETLKYTLENVAYLDILLTKYSKVDDYLYNVKLNSRLKGIRESIEDIINNIEVLESVENYIHLVNKQKRLEVTLSKKESDLKQVEKELSKYRCSKCKQIIRA